MAKKGKGLAVFAIILGLLGSGLGGYSIVKDYILEVESEENDLPKARVYYEGPDGFYLYSGDSSKLLNFTHASYDTHNAFNFSADTYVIPESGFYQISAQFVITAEPGDTFIIYIMKNNTIQSFKGCTASVTTSHVGVSVSDIVNASAGDTISIRGYFYNSVYGSRSISKSEYHTFFAIAKLA